MYMYVYVYKNGHFYKNCLNVCVAAFAFGANL